MVQVVDSVAPDLVAHQVAPVVDLVAQDLVAQAAPVVDLADQGLVVHHLAEGSFSII